MHTLQNILATSKEQKWPYPKTFEALKSAGVSSYNVDFAHGHGYNSLYTGTFGTFKEAAPKGYVMLKAANEFSAEKVEQAIKDHIEKQTTYIQCISDLAASGVTHYRVDMQKRTVTYFNQDESQSHQEHVPVL